MAAARRERLAAARTGFDMGVPFNELNRVFDLGFKPFSWSTRATSPRPCDQRTVGHLSSEPSLAFQELKLVWSVLHSELGSHLSGKQAIGEQAPIYWKGIRVGPDEPVNRPLGRQTEDTNALGDFLLPVTQAGAGRPMSSFMLLGACAAEMEFVVGSFELPSLRTPVHRRECDRCLYCVAFLANHPSRQSNSRNRTKSSCKRQSGKTKSFWSTLARPPRGGKGFTNRTTCAFRVGGLRLCVNCCPLVSP